MCIEGEADAIAHSFLGSPTVRVDGIDVDRSAMDRTNFGFQRRVYTVDGGRDGAIAWIEAVRANA